MVATSQPLATNAGLNMLARGGNAADASLAAAAMLCVTEPMSTGIGGDAFALVWSDGEVAGLDAAGPAPVTADPLEPLHEYGPRSITVPGAVSGWGLLAERYSRLGLAACLADAIEAAEHGFSVAPRTAFYWGVGTHTGIGMPPTVTLPRGYAPAPAAGDVVRLPELAETLRAIAKGGPEVFYSGPIAEAIAEASWLEEADLGSYRAKWVEALSVGYRGYDVLELPAPTQGVAALEALALLEGLEPDLPSKIACARLALEDAFATVRDGADVSGLIEPTYISQRRAAVARSIREPAGGTVYLCAVDSDRMAVSFIQSIFGGFGSGVVAGDTGVVLHNRGACFSVDGRVVPGKRPYHTIIPAMLLRDGGLVGPIGVMGGFIQAQAHMQLVSALVDEHLDPQAALDQPRFRVDGDDVRLEEGLWPVADSLRGLGMSVICDDEIVGFGGGQAILVQDDYLIAGSDARKDGFAGAF
jgi:gamma-glutamyltranspeptidase/glutathione hydrolase